MEDNLGLKTRTTFGFHKTGGNNHFAILFEMLDRKKKICFTQKAGHQTASSCSFKTGIKEIFLDEKFNNLYPTMVESKHGR